MESKRSMDKSFTIRLNFCALHVLSAYSDAINAEGDALERRSLDVLAEDRCSNP
jgi:hypothetical protein